MFLSSLKRTHFHRPIHKLFLPPFDAKGGVCVCRGVSVAPVYSKFCPGGVSLEAAGCLCAEKGSDIPRVYLAREIGPQMQELPAHQGSCPQESQKQPGLQSPWNRRDRDSMVVGCRNLQPWQIRRSRCPVMVMIQLLLSLVEGDLESHLT